MRTVWPPVAPVRAGPYELVWGHRTYVMGIINLSTDSFAGEGLASAEAAIAQGLRFLDEGADILDVGGESTRPGARAVPAAEELRRVLPVVKGLAGAARVPVSVDTSKAGVARAALAAGAWLVNDVTGFRGDPDMAGVVAQAGAGAVVVANHRLPLPPGRAHLRARAAPEGRATLCPRAQGAESGAAAVQATLARWQLSLQAAGRAGLPLQQIILDPGLGFGLHPACSLELLRRLPDLRHCAHAILVGPSRKGFIGYALGDQPVAERLEGTLAAVALAIAGGADAVRVHDVRAVHRVRLVADAVCRQ